MFWFCILACLAWCMVGAHVNHTHDHKAQMLKEKWGVVNVIRDLDHIKEDMSSFIELADIGKLTESELAFYVIRPVSAGNSVVQQMHDFDDNGGLDGIELRVAVEHSMEHLESVKSLDTAARMSQVEKVIDDILIWDMNADGFVDYGELSRQFTQHKDGRRRR